MASLLSFGQPAPQPATATQPQQELHEMDPFVVPAETEEGYGSRLTAIASRSVKPLMDLPAAIGIVNRELINDLDAIVGYDAVKYAVSGVARPQTNWDDSFIRGFRSVFALRDGVQTSLRRTNPLYDIERIEVIKGPTAMLLGHVSYLGGVLNFVTKQPTETPQGNLKLTVGSNEYLRFEGNASGPIIKWDEDSRANYRFTLGGTTENPPKLQETVDQKFVSGGVEFKHQNRIHFDTRLAYYRDDGYNYYMDFLDFENSIPGGWAVLSPHSTKSFSPSRKDQVSQSNDWVYLNSRLNVKTSDNGNFSLYHAYYAVDNFWNLINGVPNASVEAMGLLPRNYLSFKGIERSHDLQGQYLYRTIRNAWRNDLQLGVDQKWTKSKGGSVTGPAPHLDIRNPDFSDFNIPPWNEDTFHLGGESRGVLSGYWFQNNLTLFNDRFILIGGMRWTDSNVFATSNVANRTDLRASKPVRTYRVGAVYKPTKNISLYVVNAENINPILALDAFDRPQKDQEGQLFEAGVKFSRSGERVDLFATVAYFDQKQTFPYGSEFSEELGRVISIQLPQPDTGKGFEAEVNGRLKLAGGHADFILTYFDADLHASALGHIPPDAPETIYSFFGKYTWTAGALRGLTVGAGLHDEYKKFSGAPLFLIDVPTTFNAMARYDIGRWSFQFNGSNITNRRYIVRIHSTALAQSSRGAEFRFATNYRW